MWKNIIKCTVPTFEKYSLFRFETLASSVLLEVNDRLTSDDFLRGAGSEDMDWLYWAVRRSTVTDAEAVAVTPPPADEEEEEEDAVV